MINDYMTNYYPRVEQDYRINLDCSSCKDIWEDMYSYMSLFLYA
jgi:hypothetical protein